MNLTFLGLCFACFGVSIAEGLIMSNLFKAASRVLSPINRTTTMATRKATPIPMKSCWRDSSAKVVTPWMRVTATSQASETGIRTFHPSFMKWSYRMRSSDPRVQTKKNMKA